VRAIWVREKDATTGKWGSYYNALEQGRRNSHLKGPFKISVKGQWITLKDPQGNPATDIETAKKLAQKYDAAQEAMPSGIAIVDSNDGSWTVEYAVEQYLRLKRNKRPKTVQQYTTTLKGSGTTKGLLGFIPTGMTVKQLATADGLDRVLQGFEGAGYDKNSIPTRMCIVFSMLKMELVSKQTGVQYPSRLVSVARPVASRPKAYTTEDIDQLFSHMDEEEYVRYLFFLTTGCREQEVMYATWDDIDWNKLTYRVTGDGKKDVNFVPKNHEERITPLSSELCEQLKQRHKKMKGSRWIFPNEDGNPDGHFLRKFKIIAKDTGLNCGRCKSTISVGRYQKTSVPVACETHPCCEKHKLHRLRKTAATRWLRAGFDLETIRVWLGHKSLSVTQTYLQDDNKASKTAQERFDKAAKVNRKPAA
jgi:integrase